MIGVRPLIPKGFLYFILYFMISKFNSDEVDSNSTIEFILVDDKIQILSLEDWMQPVEKNGVNIFLNENDLFELIGSLLRMQSILKKGVKNGS
ncbi:hypothetical protein N8508_00340 [bacterium]|jgi:hypothetical protein|nr:hypothetical protein [bacterium]